MACSLKATGVTGSKLLYGLCETSSESVPRRGRVLIDSWCWHGLGLALARGGGRGAVQVEKCDYGVELKFETVTRRSMSSTQRAPTTFAIHPVTRPVVTLVWPFR